MTRYKRILVTGGAGFIGSHLVDGLINRGYQVRVLDNLYRQIHPSGKIPSYFNPKAEFVKGDVTRKRDWLETLRGIDAIFHYAATVGVGQSMYEIEHYVKVNSLGTALLLDILANSKHSVKKVVVASSMSSYGEGLYSCPKCGRVRPPLRPFAQLQKKDFNIYCPNCQKIANPIPTIEDTLQNSNSVYAITKKNQEELVINVGLAYGIPSVALRFFNVYGPRQSLSNPYNGVAAIFISRIKNHKSPILNEDGFQSRDFIYVTDVVSASIAALENPAANYQSFNVGSGKAVTIKKIADTLCRLYKTDAKPQVSFKVRKLDVRHCFADITKITTLLDWHPKINLNDGLTRVIKWSEKEKAVDKLDYSLHQLAQRGLR